MRRIAIISAAVALVSAVGLLYFKMTAFSDTEHERVQKALWRLKHLDTIFNEGVLQARFGLVDNYDDFHAYDEELRSLVEILNQPPEPIDPAGRAAIEAACNQLVALWQERQVLFERFKSQNAMLANSRGYLPVALGELAARLGQVPGGRELEAIISDVTRLTLARLSSPDELPANAAARMQKLTDWCSTHADSPEARFVASLVRHAQHIVTGSGEVDGLTRTLLALPTPASIDRLSQAYDREVSKDLQRIRQYRLLLYVVSFLLVTGIGYTFLALHAANNRLEQRVEERTRDLARSEERFRTLCVASPIGIFMNDAAGRCVYTNPALQTISGIVLEKSGGEPWSDILHPEDRNSVLADWAVATRDQQAFAREFRLQPPQQELRWVSSRTAPVQAGDGKITGFVGTVENITERKRAEAELEVVHKQLVQASRQAGMAEVATGVLHNVGNVLNSVNVTATLIFDQLRKSPVLDLERVAALLREQEANIGAFLTHDPKGQQIAPFLGQLADLLKQENRNHLQEIDSLRKNIEHIKGIVAMQQNYAKVSGVPELVDVADLVEDSLRMNASALQRHHVEIIREYARIPPINTDKHKVLQILVNLVQNAKNACAESGQAGKRLIVRVANGGGVVKISVTDNGIGIPTENLTRIFGHGFTTRKNGHGFGLHSGALAAREVSGSLTCHSDGPGHGATFVLELPSQTPDS